MSKLAGNTMDRVKGLAPAADARAAIVAALASVPELHPTPAPPTTPTPYAAWPSWALSTYSGGQLSSVAVHEYDVRILLPADYLPHTIEGGDSLLAKVAAALYPIGDLVTAQPISLAFDNAPQQPALQLRVIPRIA